MPLPLILPFDPPALFLEVIADALAQISLELDRVASDGAAGSAGTLQFPGEVVEKFSVVREIVQDGHGLAASAGFLEPELHNDACRKRGVSALFDTALAFPGRPAACRTDLPDPG